MLIHLLYISVPNFLSLIPTKTRLEITLQIILLTNIAGT